MDVTRPCFCLQPCSFRGFSQTSDPARHDFTPDMIRSKTAARLARRYLAGLVQLLLHPGDGHLPGCRSGQGAGGSEQQPPATNVRHSTCGPSAPSLADTRCTERSRAAPSAAEQGIPLFYHIFLIILAIGSYLKPKNATCPYILVDYLELCVFLIFLPFKISYKIIIKKNVL